MRAKRNGYGVQESYAGYGLVKNRAKVLLKECRTGKHAGLLRARTTGRTTHSKVDYNIYCRGEISP